MPHILVTGMSGAGKSTLLQGLARRGHAVVDTDHDGWVLADGRWDEPRMRNLLDREGNIVVSGTVENQVIFYGQFDHVVLLSLPLDRVTARTSNPYGSRPQDLEEIAGYVEMVEPLLRLGATIELDGRDQPASLVAAVEGLLFSLLGNRGAGRLPCAERPARDTTPPCRIRLAGLVPVGASIASSR